MQSYMKEALTIAKKGEGFVNPNPLVGALIIKDDRIIAKGYHKQFGGLHAEIEAFNNAKESVTGATMVVTLEPCSHYGKTPPCAQAIIDKKIKKVVIASKDPNPLVAGKGIAMLMSAGIEVDIGLMDAENKALNAVFFKYIENKEPFVLMKSAMTLDGKIASVAWDSKWITNQASRANVHYWRHKLSAIMVGVNTVIHDNPKLTARMDSDKVAQPLRVILDTEGIIPLDSYVCSSAQTYDTLVVIGEHVSKQREEAMRATGVKAHRTGLKSGQLDLKQLMKDLGRMGIDSILLEGGSTVNYSALEAGIVDRVHMYVAPKMIGGAQALSPVGGIGKAKVADAYKLKLASVEHFDDDVLLDYHVVKEAV